MGELGHVPRTADRADVHSASLAIAGPVAQMNRSARVDALAAQGAALNGQSAPVQFSGRGSGKGDGKKSNNKKQEKQKAAAAGKKRGEARKETKQVNSFVEYQSKNKKLSTAEVTKAVRKLKADNVRVPGGHRSGGKGDGMNRGTIEGNKKILAELKSGKGQPHNGDSDEDEWDEEDAAPDDGGYDYPDYDSDRKDFGGPGNGGSPGGGSAAIAT